MLTPFGRGSSQSALTRARWARPPQWRSPTPQPVSSTAWPGAKRGSDEDATVPAKSMPGTKGNWRTILPAPVIASASL